MTVVLTAPTTEATCTTYNNNANGGAVADATNTDPVTDPGLITCHVLPPSLHVVKTPDGATYNLGDTINWTIVVSNTGTGTAHTVTLNDTLPNPNGTLVWGPARPFAATCSGQAVRTSCTVSGNALSCDLGTLAPGESCTIVVSSPTSTANTADCDRHGPQQHGECNRRGRR